MQMEFEPATSFGRKYYTPLCENSRLIKELIYNKKTFDHLTQRHIDILKKLGVDITLKYVDQPYQQTSFLEKKEES